MDRRSFFAVTAAVAASPSLPQRLSAIEKLKKAHPDFHFEEDGPEWSIVGQSYLLMISAYSLTCDNYDEFWLFEVTDFMTKEQFASGGQALVTEKFERLAERMREYLDGRKLCNS